MKITKTAVILLTLALGSLFGASAPTRMAVTSAEVAFRYMRPDTSTCSWEISESATYAPLVSNIVNHQTDSGTTGGRWFVVIALSDNTLHYWRQTCGSEVYTGTFTTKTISNLESGSTVYLSLGGNDGIANGVTVQYGSLPTLGSSADAECAPGCHVSIPVATGALLFYRYFYKNGSDALGDFSSLHVVGM